MSFVYIKGLVMPRQEVERQRDFVRRAAPGVDASKLAVYGEGHLAYTMTPLTPKERKVMRRAGYEWCGNCWWRENAPQLTVVK